MRSRNLNLHGTRRPVKKARARGERGRRVQALFEGAAAFRRKTREAAAATGLLLRSCTVSAGMAQVGFSAFPTLKRVT
jgi:hypothetical protein